MFYIHCSTWSLFLCVKWPKHLLVLVCESYFGACLQPLHHHYSYNASMMLQMIEKEECHSNNNAIIKMEYLQFVELLGVKGPPHQDARSLHCDHSVFRLNLVSSFSSVPIDLGERNTKAL